VEPLTAAGLSGQASAEVMGQSRQIAVPPQQPARIREQSRILQECCGRWRLRIVLPALQLRRSLLQRVIDDASKPR